MERDGTSLIFHPCCQASAPLVRNGWGVYFLAAAFDSISLGNDLDFVRLNAPCVVGLFLQIDSEGARVVQNSGDQYQFSALEYAKISRRYRAQLVFGEEIE